MTRSQGMNWIRPTTRLAIYLRDGLACVYCGQALEDGVQLTLDHIKPWCRGGRHSPGNLVTSCFSCNASRGTKTLRAWRGEEVARVARNARRRVVPRDLALTMIKRRGSLRAALEELA